MIDSLVQKIFTIGAILSVKGGARIYHLWNIGKPDIDRERPLYESVDFR